MTGHKTRSVFERYNIVSEGDLLAAAKRLDELGGHSLGIAKALGVIDARPTACFTEKKLEAPPGFEPGMEVLQTSALPLGDGAGRTLRPIGSLLLYLENSGRGENQQQQHPPPKRRREGCDVRTVMFICVAETNRCDLGSRDARSARERSWRRSASVAERAGATTGRVILGLARERSWRRSASVAERAGATTGRAVINIGAGNGIRTRDFDLGKVALYH